MAVGIERPSCRCLPRPAARLRLRVQWEMTRVDVAPAGTSRAPGPALPFAVLGFMADGLWFMVTIKPLGFMADGVCGFGVYG